MVKTFKPQAAETSLHLYFCHCGVPFDEDSVKRCLALMPPAMQASILRYRFRRDQLATLLGKLLLLRALLIHYKDAGREKFNALQLSQFGKPFIAGGPEFSITHSGEIVGLAVSRQGLVGLDVEKIRPVDIEEFHQFFPEIAPQRGKVDPLALRELFFDYWTQKEAISKGIGEGLLMPLEQITVEEGRARCRETTWFVKKVVSAAGYSCHIATDQPLSQLVIEWVTPQEFDPGDSRYH
jgi:4'-phosphopantetheinyl transferase